jgi:hypothetical protein
MAKRRGSNCYVRHVGTFGPGAPGTGAHGEPTITTRLRKAAPKKATPKKATPKKAAQTKAAQTVPTFVDFEDRAWLRRRHASGYAS